MLQQAAYYLQLLILGFITPQVPYQFFFSVVGKIRSRKKFNPAKSLRRIRIFIPGYKEDAVIIASAKSAVAHNYPNDKFEVLKNTSINIEKNIFSSSHS